MEGPIIFFDGHCALCNGFVDFIQSRDRRGQFHYAPLQGATYAARVGISDGGNDWMRSIVLSDSLGLHRKSDAVLRVLSGLGGLWRCLGVLRACPRPLRDLAYDFIARNRYRWFGKRETCRLPSQSEANRFLP